MTKSKSNNNKVYGHTGLKEIMTKSCQLKNQTLQNFGFKCEDEDFGEQNLAIITVKWEKT